jgi:hypothetical protein
MYQHLIKELYITFGFLNREMRGDKIDIYDFGVILLEIVSGKPITSHYEVQMMKIQVNSQIDLHLASFTIL